MTPDSQKISDIDRRLLRLLQENSRRTNKELAELVGIAQSTCLERIRSLTDRGIIVGWRAEVDLAKLGLSVRALINVSLRPKTTASVRAFQHDTLALPEVIAISTVAGPDDFIVEVAVADVAGLREFVLNHITSRNDVTDARTSLIYEQARTAVIEFPDDSESESEAASPAPTTRRKAPPKRTAASSSS